MRDVLVAANRTVFPTLHHRRQEVIRRLSCICPKLQAQFKSRHHWPKLYPEPMVTKTAGVSSRTIHASCFLSVGINVCPLRLKRLHRLHVRSIIQIVLRCVHMSIPSHFGRTSELTDALGRSPAISTLSFEITPSLFFYFSEPPHN